MSNRATKTPDGTMEADEEKRDKERQAVIVDFDAVELEWKVGKAAIPSFTMVRILHGQV